MGHCCRHAPPCHLLCLFVLAQLLPWVSTEEFLVFGPSGPVVAAPGGEAMLPCSVFPAMSVENMDLRWFRTRFSEAVFVYRDRREQKEEQMAEFSGRTSLVKDQFHQGQAAVRIHNVQATDSGIYICHFRQGLFYEEAIVELKVAATGSVPEVYIQGPQDDGVCVVCVSSGWYPKPQVQWRHHRGRNLPASSETHTEDAEGLFSVETSLVVRDSSLRNVTCSIFSPSLGQEKAMAIVIPEPFFPQASPWMPAFLVTLSVMALLVLGTSCFLRREHSARLQVQRELKSLPYEKERFLRRKEDALSITNQRKRAYMAAWRTAQLYADWRKELFQACSVTLDADSAHPILAISQDRMSVTWKETTMWLDDLFCVLGKEGISSGRCYWEVEIRNGHSSKWVLGVCREDVKRKGVYVESPAKGFWTVGRSSGGYWAYEDTGRETLSLRQAPQSVGVFVDYSEGDISFYNMSDKSHIFSFCDASFSGRLFPYFRLKSRNVSMIVRSSECEEEEEGRRRRKKGRRGRRGRKRGEKSVKRSFLPSLEKSGSPSGEGLGPGSCVVDSLPGEKSPFLLNAPFSQSVITASRLSV
ncbi:butyrophilin subfamily 3 member A1-like [Acomys russatus]|uniref:butyrophilin subfamily 3 member A1-like n=1 Tax=Acomys russatus TaxID=60746 RepID=UPI0021E1E1B0|nr:butyrophilin subfamily 3 member A1-like [Acomys russatus]